MTALDALTTELTAALSTSIPSAGYFGTGRQVVRDTWRPRTAVPFNRITESGVAGDVRPASSEKGERMLSGCASAPADIFPRDPWAKSCRDPWAK
ncbi:hypothetical protein GCM10011579_088010 [Streptomyces albiflavescens]|uniref:Uncharacterized protein n=1 Tax=Streptomyces albiflavescens TaxID=1623582 RepID=A0A918D9T7_9ACTN|nr:hypothetical protein [Streptomyces albiflavescens]GGN91290.1 hypothetical protein GCM10011579_088010 [Streptomyces albiflavescens]